MSQLEFYVPTSRYDPINNKFCAGAEFYFQPDFSVLIVLTAQEWQELTYKQFNSLIAQAISDQGYRYSNKIDFTTFESMQNQLYNEALRAPEKLRHLVGSSTQSNWQQEGF
ncbi:hypothetical protein [Gimesia chilikensis]|uniref:hypothetical protein n=1 Tax=Gimesia chilikensis TaxID=2605989 RepID=UPI003A943348